MTADRMESSLVEAYRATTYRGKNPETGQQWSLRIDERSTIEGPAAYITSDNPGSKQLDLDENARRRQKLETELRGRFEEVYPGWSIADEGDWPDEHGFWVRPVECDEAVDVANRWGQNAIVFVDEHREVQLVFCN